MFKLVLGRFALMLTSIIFAGLLLEGTLRVYFVSTHRDIRNYQPSFIFGNDLQEKNRFVEHPFLPYAARPRDARKIFIYREEIDKTVEYDVEANSLGFRTSEHPFKIPSQTKRIVTLGGSTTWDGPTNSETWPALLEKKLNEVYRNTGYRIEAINLGLDMGSSPMSVIILAFIGIQYQPNLIISYDGVNDTALLGYEGITPDYSNIIGRYDSRVQTLQSRLPTWAFHSYLLSVASNRYDIFFHTPQDIYTQVMSMKASQLKPSVNEIEGVQLFERNLRTMRGIAGEYHTQFLAATAHWVNPSEKVNRLNEELRRFFYQAQINYLDLDRLLAHDDWSLHVDQIHWTRKGLDFVAERFKEKIIADNLLGLNRSQ